MVGLVTCKNEEDPIKNKRAREVTTLFCSSAVNSIVGDAILLQFNLPKDFMIVLVASKNEDDPPKNQGTRVGTTIVAL